MRELIRNTASAVIGGLIVALISYFLFTNRSSPPTVEVFQRTIAFPSQIGNKIVNDLVGIAKDMGWNIPVKSYDPDPILAGGKFFSGLYIKSYVIKNGDNKIYHKLNVRPHGFKLVELFSDGKAVSVKNDSDNFLDIRPSENIVICAIADSGDYGVSSPSVSFSLNDSEILVQDEDFDSADPIFRIATFAENNPFISFMIFMLMFISLGVFAFLIIWSIVVYSYPLIILRSYSSNDIGKVLAFVKHVEQQDIEKYMRFKSSAERWTKKLFPSLPN